MYKLEEYRKLFPFYFNLSTLIDARLFPLHISDLSQLHGTIPR